MAATKTGLRLGAKFSERFIVEALLGVGPMGEVFQVIDQGKTFALKVFLPRVVPAYLSAAKIKGVYDEYAVNHPAIVRPLEIGEAEGLKFAVLPFVRGAGLQTLLAEMADAGKSGDARTAGLIADRLGAILEHLPPTAVHGGVKPGNVLVGGLAPSGPVRDDAPFFLTDWGTPHLLSFSKYASLQLSAGAPYYYLAPEFVSYGGKIDQRADQYAIGALLYEFLTGKPPRKGFRAASQLNPDVTEEWDDLLGRLLAPKPDQRFARMGDLRQAVHDLVGPLPGMTALMPAALVEEPAAKEKEAAWVADAFDNLLDKAIAQSEAIVQGEAAEPAAVPVFEETAPVEEFAQLSEAELAGETAAAIDQDVAAAAAELFGETPAAREEPVAAETPSVEAEIAAAEEALFGGEPEAVEVPAAEPVPEEEPLAVEETPPAEEVVAPFEPEPPAAELLPEEPVEAAEPVEEALVEEPAVEEPEIAAAPEEVIPEVAEEVPAVELPTEEPAEPAVAEGELAEEVPGVVAVEEEPELPAEEVVVAEQPEVETAAADERASLEAEAFAAVSEEAAAEPAPSETPVAEEAAALEAVEEAGALPEAGAEALAEPEAVPAAPEDEFARLRRRMEEVEAAPPDVTFEELLADTEAAASAPPAEAAAEEFVEVRPRAPRSSAGLWATVFGGLVVIALVVGYFAYSQGWIGGGAPPEATPLALVVATPEPTPEATPAPTPEETEQVIAQLINEANALIDKKQFTKPAGDCALPLVKKVESLDSTHPYPAQARSKMLADLGDRFDQAMAKEDFVKAVDLANEALLIKPGDAEFKANLAKAQQGLDSLGETKKLAKLVEQLKWYMNKKIYVKPAGQCALATVEDIEKIQDGHAEAAKARKQMVSVRTGQAEEYLKTAKWDEAIAMADEGLLVEPKNAKLLALKKKAEASKQLAMATPTPEATPKPAQLCGDGMHYVAGGSVRLGSSPEDPLRKAGEKPNTPTYVAAFCIDLYEYPNQPGAAPKTNVSWSEAKQFCEGQGKRLCSEAEWERTCKGPANQRFPYGNEFNPNVCATQNADGQKRTVAGAGGWAGCRSNFGVYDLSGNVREWTSSPVAPGQPAYVLKGGAADEPDWAVRCAVRMPAGPSTKSYLVGFRCCNKPAE
jgi:formylglycine-generating enzyme required for sulfatase activity